METFNSLTTHEQQLVYAALEILGDDFDAAYTALQDEGIYIEFEELQEISEHFQLV